MYLAKIFNKTSQCASYVSLSPFGCYSAFIIPTHHDEVKKKQIWTRQTRRAKMSQTVLRGSNLKRKTYEGRVFDSSQGDLGPLFDIDTFYVKRNDQNRRVKILNDVSAFCTDRCWTFEIDCYD